MSIRKEQKPGSHIIYLIDEENGIVQAKIATDLMYSSIYDDCRKYDLMPDGVWDMQIEDKNSYIIGTARCAAEDTFNIETGKSIARARMLQKYYTKKLKGFQSIAESLDKQLQDTEDLLNYSWLAVNRFIEQEKNAIL